MSLVFLILCLSVIVGILVIGSGIRELATRRNTKIIKNEKTKIISPVYYLPRENNTIDATHRKALQALTPEDIAFLSSNGWDAPMEIKKREVYKTIYTDTGPVEKRYSVALECNKCSAPMVYVSSSIYTCSECPNTYRGV